MQSYFWQNQNFYWYATLHFHWEEIFQNDDADPVWGLKQAEFSAEANQHISIKEEVKWFIGAAELVIIIIFVWRR